MVVEAFEDVEVFVDGDVGYDIHFSWRGGGGLFPCVDGVEGEEGGGFVDADEAFVVYAVDYEPGVLLGRVEGHGVEHVSGPEDFEAALGVVGVEDAEDDVVLGQQDGVQVGGFDGAAG